MAKRNQPISDNFFSFFEALKQYYVGHKGKIRRNYKDISRKYLDYNDPDINPKAFLRRPQFEALEMYVFIKEFLNNQQIYDIFTKWYRREGIFSDASYYAVGYHGQQSMYELNAMEYRRVFETMQKNAEQYPNYIYALTMGLGKTILMATCIFYEFLLADRYPKDPRFCHNALVFAPDKTVLQSLKEIQTFDKSLVVPKEYSRVLDSNIKFHFLYDTDLSLATVDGSDFNIIISNTQKILLKKVHKEKTPMDKLFEVKNTINSKAKGIMDDLYDFTEISDAGELMINQRFEKLTRLPQIGIYVDEAHHMFGKELEKAFLKNNEKSSLRNTINELAYALEEKGTNVVACYNYTGTPYVNNSVLPEVVYYYGLRGAIYNGYLKNVDDEAYENVKSSEFIKRVIKDFFAIHGDKRYEGLLPKIAIFGAKIDELMEEIKPAVEEALTEIGQPTSKILVNVGDEKITKDKDIFDFQNLDVVGTDGSEKQVILLVGKGTEGWNCRSLFSVAMYRSPSSKVFVLQATMRCLRKITDLQQTAKVYLSKENRDILNSELQANFKVSIDDIKKPKDDNKIDVEVRIVPPIRKIKLNRVEKTYKLTELRNDSPLSIDISDETLEKYKSYKYSKEGLLSEHLEKKQEIVSEQKEFSKFTLVAEISRYLNIPCLQVEKIIDSCEQGVDYILDLVNSYNETLYDIVIPKIFNNLYEVKSEIKSSQVEVNLLSEPTNGDYYEFRCDKDLLVNINDLEAKKNRNKSFHTDNYCFDSKPEKECFWQYLDSNKVKEVYFTGMFTSKQNGLYISYIDPETNTLRHYYPDFIAKLDDDTYEIIEVKGDNKLEDAVVTAKKEAAELMASESKMKYKMLASSDIMRNKII